MKNNESIFGHLVFAYEVVIVLIILKHFGQCEVIPDKLLIVSFIVITTAELIAIVHDSLTRGISALIDAYEDNKRWHQFNKPIEDSEVKLYWSPEAKEIIQVENKNKQ